MKAHHPSGHSQVGPGRNSQQRGIHKVDGRTFKQRPLHRALLFSIDIPTRNIAGIRVTVSARATNCAPKHHHGTTCHVMPLSDMGSPDRKRNCAGGLQKVHDFQGAVLCSSYEVPMGPEPTMAPRSTGRTLADRRAQGQTHSHPNIFPRRDFPGKLANINSASNSDDGTAQQRGRRDLLVD